MKVVEYDIKKQKNLVFTFLNELYKGWNEIYSSAPEDWTEICRGVAAEFSIDLCMLKHPGFFEEQEYRAIRLMLVDEDPDAQLRDPGGRRGGDRSAEPVLLRSRATQLGQVSYIALPIDVDRRNSVIRDIIIGPKNLDSIHSVRTRVKQLGFRDFTVRKSRIPYR